MRFLLFDRVTDLVPGKRIQGVKTFSMTDPMFDGHFPRKALVPAPLIIESMIQLLAWTAISKHDFTLSCVLSVLEDVTLPPELGPGHKIDLFGELVGTNKKGSIGRAWAEIDGEEIARAGRVIYGHVPHPDPEMLRKRFAYFGGPA